MRIEGIFPIFAVKRHKTLVVHTVLSAFGPCVRGEVKHIPDMRGPDEFSGIQLLDQFLMILCLILLAVIPLTRLPVMPVQSLRAVFAHADGRIRIPGMERIHPRPVHLHGTTVPSKIQVVGQHIRNMHNGIVDGAHAHRCHGCGSCGIHLVAQIIEDAVVLQHVLIGGRHHGDLIGQSPDHNGRVIVVLNDQLCHLADGVLPAIGHVRGNIGNFRPDHQSALIAQIIENLAVLIMRQTDGVGTEFADQVDVFLVMLPFQGIADFRPVLVAAHTAQRIRLSVENEALLRINPIGTHAEARADLILELIIHKHAHSHGVEIRILPALPEMRLLQFKTGRGTGHIQFLHFPAFRIQNPIAEMQMFRHLTGPDLDIH